MQLLRRCLDLGHGRADPRDVTGAGLGQGHAACGAVEQPCLQPCLQAGHRMAQRRGRHAQLACGRTETATPGHGEDRIEFNQTGTVHGMRPIVPNTGTRLRGLARPGHG